MKEIIFYAAFASLMFNIGRVMDIAWPTPFFPWPLYVVSGAIWFGILAATHP
jgi:hypothetical protein